MRTFHLLLTAILLLIASLLTAQENYLYVSDAGNFNNPPWQILRYDIDGTNPQVFISNDFFVGESVGWPQDILFIEDQGVVLISCLVGNRITKHNATTGAYIEDFAIVDGGPTRMKIGADNLIYVLQWSNSINKVLRFQQDGTFVDEFTDTGVNNSIGLDWDTNGNLYVSSYGTSKVHKFDTSGVWQGEFINTELSGPTNIYHEADGNWVVLNWNGGNIKRFDSDGNFIEVITTDVTQPEGICLHPTSGNYVVGNGGPAQVDEFQSDGTFVQSIVAGGEGGLLQPNAVVVREATFHIDEKMKSKTMVTPSMGTKFQIAHVDLQNIKTIEVFNLHGSKVASIPTEENYWNAEWLSEGLYFLTAKEKNTIYTQKIIVKK